MLDYKALGKRIRKARILCGLTQEQLAEAAELSLSHISNIETANTCVSLPTLMRLANILSITPNALLLDSYENNITVHELEIKNLLEDCTLRERQILVQTLTALKEALRTP